MQMASFRSFVWLSSIHCACLSPCTYAYIPMCCAQSLQLCLTLYNPMDCSWPGPSDHGIFQGIIMEWVAMPSSRGSSEPTGWTWVSCLSSTVGRFFITEPQGKPIHLYPYLYIFGCFLTFSKLSIVNKYLCKTTKQKPRSCEKAGGP